MSGTNWIVLIAVVILIILGVWYYTGADDGVTGVSEPAAVDAPVVEPATEPADTTAPEAPADDTTAN